MTADHAKLRALAEAATPGPWSVTETPGFGHDHAPYTVADGNDEQVADCWDNTPGERLCERNEANAAFIAAANPQTVLGLLDEIDRLRNTDIGEALLDYDRAAQENERLRARLSTLQSLCIEACDIARRSSYANRAADVFEADQDRIAAIRKEAGGSK